MSLPYTVYYGVSSSYLNTTVPRNKSIQISEFDQINKPICFLYTEFTLH